MEDEFKGADGNVAFRVVLGNDFPQMGDVLALVGFPAASTFTVSRYRLPGEWSVIVRILARVPGRRIDFHDVVAVHPPMAVVLNVQTKVPPRRAGEVAAPTSNSLSMLLS